MGPEARPDNPMIGRRLCIMNKKSDKDEFRRVLDIYA